MNLPAASPSWLKDLVRPQTTKAPAQGSVVGTGFALTCNADEGVLKITGDLLRDDRRGSGPATFALGSPEASEVRIDLFSSSLRIQLERGLTSSKFGKPRHVFQIELFAEGVRVRLSTKMEAEKLHGLPYVQTEEGTKEVAREDMESLLRALLNTHSERIIIPSWDPSEAVQPEERRVRSTPWTVARRTEPPKTVYEHIWRGQSPPARPNMEAIQALVHERTRLSRTFKWIATMGFAIFTCLAFVAWRSTQTGTVTFRNAMMLTSGAVGLLLIGLSLEFHRARDQRRVQRLTSQGVQALARVERVERVQHADHGPEFTRYVVHYVYKDHHERVHSASTHQSTDTTLKPGDHFWIYFDAEAPFESVEHTPRLPDKRIAKQAQT